MASRSFLVFYSLAINNAVSSPLTDGLSFLYSRQAPGGGGGGAQLCRMNFTTDVWTGCDDLLAQFDLTLEEFMLANPSIGEACDGFKPGETYCVAPYIDVAVNATKDGTCGREIDFSKTCVGSDFGDCCGADGKCGSGEKFCGIGNCQEGACLGGGPWSTDGRCGRSVDYVPCPPKFGLCCSKGGTCGNDTVSCGAGCQYGDCSGTETTTSTTAKPSATQMPGSVSKDGTCAYKAKLTCKGSKFGDCCSAAGYCGNTEYHCDKYLGCQLNFGKCS